MWLLGGVEGRGAREIRVDCPVRFFDARLVARGEVGAARGGAACRAVCVEADVLDCGRGVGGEGGEVRVDSRGWGEAEVRAVENVQESGAGEGGGGEDGPVLVGAGVTRGVGWEGESEVGEQRWVRGGGVRGGGVVLVEGPVLDGDQGEGGVVSAGGQYVPRPPMLDARPCEHLVEAVRSIQWIEVLLRPEQVLIVISSF